jgi:hypothetical protein
MGHSSRNIVGITPFSKVDIVSGCALSVPDETMKQRNFAVFLTHEHVPELMGQGEGSQ